MVKRIIIVLIGCIVAGAVLISTVNAEDVAELPHLEALNLDLRADNESVNKDIQEENIDRKSKVSKSVQKESPKVSEIAKEVPKEVPTVPEIPKGHQHKWVAQYKTIQEQQGTKTVIHYYCYKCKGDITYLDKSEHLKNCGTDMYSSKKLQEPIYADVKVFDHWECECGGVKYGTDD